MFGRVLEVMDLDVPGVPVVGDVLVEDEAGGGSVRDELAVEEDVAEGGDAA
jgi:hypothetical protein